jgi:hypothetical protein
MYVCELDGPAVSALRRSIAEVKQRWSVIALVYHHQNEYDLHRWQKRAKLIVPLVQNRGDLRPKH